jgi:polysaccharide pyruvyl transferase WcaK-like protein
MKIGILTYHAVYNFGANLQTVSTFNCLKNRGHDPIVIDFFPANLEASFERTVPKEQGKAHKTFVKSQLKTTNRCQNAKEIAKIISDEKLDAVIIGSDAVVQHHPLLSRIQINPSKKRLISFSVDPVRYEANFPNPFWGEFISYLNHPIPVALMSVSCQNSDFRLIGRQVKKSIFASLKQFCYISVRDTQTHLFFKHITRGTVAPVIKPDPVFALNKNVKEQPSRTTILEKFNLPQKYLLLSFNSQKIVSQHWVSTFDNLASNAGYQCVAFPMPGGILFTNNLRLRVEIPLDPMDWYSIIKYSDGYIGEKMHPVVVSLLNNIPFFSFDHYGITKFKLFTKEKVSKIYDLLDRAQLGGNRISTLNRVTFKTPHPQHVLDKIMSFDKQKCSSFSERMQQDYEEMMAEILATLQHEKCKVNPA